MIYYMEYNSPIGKLTIASDEESIIGLWIENQKYFKNITSKNVIKNNKLEIMIKAKDWLDRYFNGKKPKTKELSLKLNGSDFRKKVWEILCDIPYGKVTTYKEIASKIAKLENKKMMSAQAVGGAIGHNPISIIIPCHRVIGTDGKITGYAAGIDIKRKLLEFENPNIKLK